jgi:hypothetical protein
VFRSSTSNATPGGLSPGRPSFFLYRSIPEETHVTSILRKILKKNGSKHVVM